MGIKKYLIYFKQSICKQLWRKSKMQNMGRKPVGRPPVYHAEWFEGLPCTAKLVWFYVLENGEDRYNVEGLARALGISTASAHRAMRSLLDRGLLRAVELPRGSRAGVYRAASRRFFN